MSEREFTQYETIIMDRDYQLRMRKNLEKSNAELRAKIKELDTIIEGQIELTLDTVEDRDALLESLRLAVKALERAADNVTWVEPATDGESEVTLTYGYHVWHCQKALIAIKSLHPDITEGAE